MISKMREIQKTTLRDITTSVRMYYDPNPMSSSTAVKEDKQILESYEEFKITQNDSNCASPWILRLELDKMEMAARGGIDMGRIATQIQKNKSLHAFECIYSDTNTPGKMIMRVVFGPDVVKNALSLRFVEEKLLDTVITGIDGIGRVYLRQLNREVEYDTVTGGYAPLKQYVLDVEGANLMDLSTLPDVDPMRSFSNDIHEILEVFGIETARMAMYEEFAEVFEEAYVNYHHVITLVDTMTYPGYILSADRFGMSKSDSGVLARSSFEETSKVLFNAAITGEFDSMKGVSANIMFGQKPPCGTGLVDILLDETKLPEGVEEEISVFDAEIEDVNQKISANEGPDGVCRTADIIMEW
jgi:DNA-directed RNA polymerase II subunit RPB1